MNYKGYTYTEQTERDDEDILRRYHYAVPQSGRPISLDYTPWTSMTQFAFRALVDLGFPPRPAGKVTTPWTEGELETAVEELEYTNEFTMYNDSLTEL